MVCYEGYFDRSINFILNFAYYSNIIPNSFSHLYENCASIIYQGLMVGGRCGTINGTISYNIVHKSSESIVDG